MARPVERTFVALVAGGSVAVTIAHGIDAALREWLQMPGQDSATILTLAVLLLSIGFAIARLFVPGPGRLLPVAPLLSAAGAAGVAAFGNGFGAASLSAAAAGMAQAYLADRIASMMPATLDGSLSRRPVRSLLWAVLGVLLLVQTGRLGTYMADPSVDWWLTTRNEWWAKHMCMPAYVQAADYNRQGEPNVYDERHYPAVTRDGTVHLAVRRMDAFVGDPYQYPPQFLLVPSIGLWLTNDFLTMRTVWYSLQVLGFVLVAALLAWWLRSEAGWTPMLLIPLVWVSVPAMQNFQYGQFHLATIVLAVAGMLAFERRRDPLGGMLLAFAILAKLFPAVLLVPMAVQRRWRALAWTAGWIVATTLVAWMVVGPGPFEAFLGYQLPRLSGGGAFAAFTRDWPEFREMIIANVVSLYGVVHKLRELGVAGMSDGLAIWVMRIYSVFVLVVAALGGRAGSSGASRLSRALLWLALLNLAALQTSLAWGDYVTVGTVWLLSLVAAQPRRSKWQRLLIGACWVFTVLDLGIVPMPTLPPAAVMMAVTGLGALLLPAFNGWIALGKSPARG